MGRPHSQRKMCLCACVNLHADTHCVTAGQRPSEWPCDCACVTAPPDETWCVLHMGRLERFRSLSARDCDCVCVYTVTQEGGGPFCDWLTVCVSHGVSVCDCVRVCSHVGKETETGTQSLQSAGRAKRHFPHTHSHLVTLCDCVTQRESLHSNGPS